MDIYCDASVTEVLLLFVCTKIKSKAFASLIKAGEGFYQPLFLPYYKQNASVCSIGCVQEQIGYCVPISSATLPERHQ